MEWIAQHFPLCELKSKIIKIIIKHAKKEFIKKIPRDNLNSAFNLQK